MTQEEIDTLYSITIILHEDKYFGKRKKPLQRELVQKWVAEQLAKTLNIYTVPCGMSWGVLTTKEHFDEYWQDKDIDNHF